MIHEDLTVLGLSDNEAKVYLALSGVGKVRAADIIKETGLHRNLVYQALDELVLKRLASKTTQTGVFRFQTTDPEHLRDSINEREAVVARVIDELKERGKLSEQEITIYEGEDAVRSFSLKNAKRLKHGEQIYVLGSGGKKFEAAMGESALANYFSEIGKRGGIKILMYRKQLYSSETFLMLRKKHGAEIHFLSFDANPSANVVFTNKSVAFHIYEKPLTVIEISNPHLVAAYKNYFDILWNQNVRVEQGLEALRDAFTDMIDELKPGEEYYVLGANVGLDDGRLGKFFDEIHRYRIERGVGANIITQSESFASIRERNRRVGDPDDKISHIKKFNTPFLSPMQINMVNGRAFMILYKNNAPTVIYFDDKTVYDGFKQYFDEIWNRQTETLYGKDGVIALCERVLDEGKDLYLIAATGSFMKNYPDYYAGFTKRRVAKGVRQYILANEDTRGGKIGTLPLSTVKYLPKAFASPMVVWIFGDHVAHVLWHEPETVFFINDAKTADYYRQYYRALEATARS
jgi:sugar-specific transcriptional regulator TrmB